MPDLGWQELVIILVMVIIIFGAGKLPEIGGQLGKGIREFKASTEGEDTPSPIDASTAHASAKIAQAPAAAAAAAPPSASRADDI